MSDPNVFEPSWEPGTPPGLRGARVGAAAGATELGATVYELEPGSAISPYHLHHGNEELLVVLSGRPLLRTPDGTRRLEPGAVVAFPRGPDGAHRVANPGDEPARVLLVSTMNLPEIAVHVTHRDGADDDRARRRPGLARGRRRAVHGALRRGDGARRGRDSTS